MLAQVLEQRVAVGQWTYMPNSYRQSIEDLAQFLRILHRDPTFPPKTSSPIIRHAAVCIVRVFLSSAEVDDVMIRL
jgi:hypothetical protein